MAVDAVPQSLHCGKSDEDEVVREEEEEGTPIATQVKWKVLSQ